jgi:tRNA-dihydrouridine synthase 3
MQVSYVMLYMQLVQKPKDLEGVCPFSDVTAVCPYGFACRYSGAHPEVKGVEVAEVLKDGNYEGKNPFSSIRELNSLNKSFQKLLWKNAVTFPRADAQLEKLGLMVYFTDLRVLNIAVLLFSL